MTKVVWREWYSDTVVEQLEAMGTLPRYETEIDTQFEDGEGVARLIAVDTSSHDAESFRTETEIVILEPAEFAGTYKICVDYEPSFHAFRIDEAAP